VINKLENIIRNSRLCLKSFFLYYDSNLTYPLQQWPTQWRLTRFTYYLHPTTTIYSRTTSLGCFYWLYTVWLYPFYSRLLTTLSRICRRPIGMSAWRGPCRACLSRVQNDTMSYNNTMCISAFIYVNDYCYITCTRYYRFQPKKNKNPCKINSYTTIITVYYYW